MNNLLQPSPVSAAAGNWMGSMARLSGTMASSGWRWMRRGLPGSLHARPHSEQVSSPHPALPAAFLDSFRVSVQVMATCESSGDASWRDLANKLEVAQRFFAHRDRSEDHGVPSGLTPSQRARRLMQEEEIYHCLWTFEAMGHGLAQQTPAYEGGEHLHRSLADLPPGSLVPFHAGVALALMGPMVERLPTVAPQASGHQMAASTLQSVLNLCRRVAVPHHAEIMFENLGLLLHNLRPRWLEPTASALAAIDPRLPHYLWHGAGRGLYFAPSQLPPGSWRRAVDKARRQDDPRARRGLISGFVFALVLVNLRHPEVLADFLRTCGDDPPDGDGLSHGIVAPLLVWRRAAGHDATLERFLSHAPTSHGERRRWRDAVQLPAQQAFQAWWPALEQHGRWGSVMRCFSRQRWASGDIPTAPKSLAPMEFGETSSPAAEHASEQGRWTA